MEFKIGDKITEAFYLTEKNEFGKCVSDKDYTITALRETKDGKSIEILNGDGSRKDTLEFKLEDSVAVWNNSYSTVDTFTILGDLEGAKNWAAKYVSDTIKDLNYKYEEIKNYKYEEI